MVDPLSESVAAPAATHAPPTVEEAAALAIRAANLLDAVEHAIGALEEGTFGACRVCGAPIEQSRLAASPSELHCAAHADAAVNERRLF